MAPSSTARLRFRPMVVSDVDLLAALLGDAEVVRFHPAPKSREDAAAWIDWNQQNYLDYGHWLWIIEGLDGGFVGDCGLTWQEVNGTSELEVGYRLPQLRA